MLVKNYSETQAATCATCNIPRNMCEDLCMTPIVYETYTMDSAEDFYFDLCDASHKHLVIVGEPDIEISDFSLSDDETEISFTDESGNVLYTLSDTDGFTVDVDCYCNAVGFEQTRCNEFFEDYRIKSAGREIILRGGTDL